MLLSASPPFSLLPLPASLSPSYGRTSLAGAGSARCGRVAHPIRRQAQSPAYGRALPRCLISLSRYQVSGVGQASTNQGSVKISRFQFPHRLFSSHPLPLHQHDGKSHRTRQVRVAQQPPAARRQSPPPPQGVQLVGGEGSSSTARRAGEPKNRRAEAEAAAARRGVVQLATAAGPQNETNPPQNETIPPQNETNPPLNDGRSPAPAGSSSPAAGSFFLRLPPQKRANC